MKPILSLALAAALILPALPGPARALPTAGASLLAQADRTAAPAPGSGPLRKASWPRA